MFVFAQAEEQTMEFSLVKVLEKSKFDWYHGVYGSFIIDEKVLTGFSFALGIQTSYFQRAFNPKTGLVLGYRFWNPNDKLDFFGAVKITYNSYLLQPNQRINQTEPNIGYQLFYGNKVKLFQSGYVSKGVERHSFSAEKWNYYSYSIEIGVCYEF